ncbi:MAG TPA: TRAP transporter substrate-binding protein DctP [Azospirillaceae bacterium]|nr:TRAP transporter substrate-binding protein DctP [Azospirillaceae bacterium]
MARLLLPLLLILSLLAPPTMAQGSDVLTGRAAANTPPGSPWDRQWGRFRDNLAGQPVRIEFFLRSELGGEEAMIAGLRRNRIQIAGLTLQGLSSAVPELAVLTLPYLFESEAEVDFVYEHYLTAPFRRLFRQRGLELLQWTEVGWTNLYADRPLLLPADAAGLKLRGSPNPAAQGFLSAIGADAVPLGIADLVPALQTKLIQGGLSGVVFHFFVTRKYASDFTLTQHSYDTGALVANAAWLARATPEQRRAVADAFGSAATTRGEVRALVAGQLKTMAAEGVRVHVLTPDQRARWVEVTAPVHEALLNELGGDARAIYDAIQRGKAAFRASEAPPPGQAEEAGEMMLPGPPKTVTLGAAGVLALALAAFALAAPARFLAGLGRAEKALCLGGFLIMAVAVFADVVWRTVTGRGIVGALQLGVVGMIMSAYFGAGLASATGTHLRPRAFDRLVAPGWEPAMVRLQEALTGLFCLGFAILAADVTADSAALGETFPVLRAVLWPVQAVLPLAFLALALRHLVYALRPDLRPAAGEAKE